MGFEPRAAERLRRAMESAHGALDVIAPLLASVDTTGHRPPADEVEELAQAGICRVPRQRFVA